MKERIRKLLVIGDQALMEAEYIIKYSKPLENSERKEVLQNLQKVKEIFWSIAEEVAE